MPDPAPLTFDAVLLAAGHSRRMGREKALLPADSGSAGERLWERQWRLLADAGAEHRWLSVRAEQFWPPDEIERFRVFDPAPDSGPLGGIVAAWRRGGASHLMVLAVDLPQLPVTWFEMLRDACRPDMGAAGRHPDGAFEPLAAIYPRAWLPAWEAALASGKSSPQSLLSTAANDGVLAVVPIRSAMAPWFRNVNSPADLAE